MDLRASCNRRIAGHCVDGNLEPTLDTRERNRVMGLQQDVSPYGSQTVMGPGWPNVDEDALAASAAQYEALAAKLTGSVVPLQQSQLASLSEKWTGGGAV